MNKIEELEKRCEQLEDRVEILEKALVAAMARVNQKADVNIWDVSFPDWRPMKLINPIDWR